MTKQPNSKRRIILINRSLQIKVAVITLVLFLIAAFSVWWEIYSAFSKLSGTGVIDESSANLMLMVSQISKTVFIKIAIFLGLVWVLAIALSHYVAGPIFRFEATLKALQKGDLNQRIRLRKFDQLRNLETEFNNTLEFLQNAVRNDRKLIDELKDSLRELQGKSSPEVGGKIGSILEKLEKINAPFNP